MKQYATDNTLIRRRSAATGTRANPYYSVEFSFKGIVANYQFKLWNTNSGHKGIIVREDSNVLTLMKAGDVLHLKYNFKNSPHLSEYLKTKIRFIIKKDKGRFKDHYLVGLGIVKSQDQY